MISVSEELPELLTQISGPATVVQLVRSANDLLARYEQLGDVRDIDLAIAAGERAVGAAGHAAGARGVALNALANARSAAYQERGRADDLLAALAAQREAVALVGPGSVGYIPFAVNLSNRLIVAFEVTRDPAMLDEAVALLGAVLGGELPDEWRAAAYNNLGLALRARFELTGLRDDLDGSLRAQRRSLELTPADAAERVNRLNNLANAQWAGYLATGLFADLDEAIASYEAAAACPANPYARAACLLGLGTARWDRWGRRRIPGDLDAAIDAFRAAGELVDEDSPTAAHCALNLGAAHFSRWRHLGQRTDLDRAIERWDAARARPAAGREVVKSATSNLGAALWERFEHAGNLDDLHGAVEMLGAGLDEGRMTLRPGQLFTLAGALRRRFELLGRSDDRDRAVVAFRRACLLGMTTNPGAALSSGQLWGEWAARRGSLVEADEAFTRATAAATGLYRRQSTDDHVAVWLGQATTLSAWHAWVQVRRGAARAAVVTLERGRAYVLSEALRNARAIDG